MNFGFNDEQKLLRSTARKFFENEVGSETVRRLMETPEGMSPELWTKLARWKELMATTSSARVREIIDRTPATHLLLTTAPTMSTFPAWLAPGWTAVYRTPEALILQRVRN